VSGIKALAEATGDASYDELPEGAKATSTHQEWLWLSDMEKARFVQNLTEPEAFIDGC
jgi:hypothetical protein